MAIFLTDRYHGMFTGWHNFLPNRPIAAHIARIHARIIWTLQSTFVPIAFIKLPGAVCAGRNSAQIKEITRVTVPDNRLLLTQEFVSYSELKWFLLNYWWRMKHLKHKNSYSLYENKKFKFNFHLNGCCHSWRFTEVLLRACGRTAPWSPRKWSTQFTQLQFKRFSWKKYSHIINIRHEKQQTKKKLISVVLITCINPSGQPGNSPVDVILLPSGVSNSLSAKPSSNRPTLNPSKIIWK